MPFCLLVISYLFIPKLPPLLTFLLPAKLSHRSRPCKYQAFSSLVQLSIFENFAERCIKSATRWDDVSVS